MGGQSAVGGYDLTGSGVKVSVPQSSRPALSDSEQETVKHVFQLGVDAVLEAQTVAVATSDRKEPLSEPVVSKHVCLNFSGNVGL